MGKTKNGRSEAKNGSIIKGKIENIRRSKAKNGSIIKGKIEKIRRSKSKKRAIIKGRTEKIRSRKAKKRVKKISSSFWNTSNVSYCCYSRFR